ncbi:MAG: helix-turn-helix transcriptional regulator, partial [Nanoarchaeota archaeon]|nr:helix-turn-helix transcriptional regulator [Nanoarchaeota archaeon]
MAKKSSINIDLNDPRAGKIADVLNSKTAKKILDLIADRGEMSGSDISNELDMPLNTVTYNLKKLVDAGLVGKSKKFFWSSKGKKMELYKVLNKQIIISP